MSAHAGEYGDFKRKKMKVLRLREQTAQGGYSENLYIKETKKVSLKEFVTFRFMSNHKRNICL